MLSSNQLSALLKPEQYRLEGRTDVFPSSASLEWFIRKHKKNLIIRGALLAPTKRKLINPDLFDDVVLEIGRAMTSGERSL
jgi:hypothetical protein